MTLTLIILCFMAAVTVFILTVGYLYLRSPKDKGSEAWRGNVPSVFRLLRPVINLFVVGVEEGMSDTEKSLLRTRLHTAGLGYSILPEEFVVVRWLGLVMGLLLIGFLLLVLEKPPVYIALIAPLGYYYPNIWLNDVIKRRHLRIEKEFPFFLELLVLVMRAGLNFATAASHSVSKMPEGPVKEEFSRMLRDIRTGLNRREALTNLAARVNLPSISNFVAAVNQAEETGGELGQALIVQAEQRRSERFLRAEKQANQAPVKMLGPLVLLLFPIVFILIFFPILMRFQSGGIGT